jgi:hypothetical protein
VSEYIVNPRRAPRAPTRCLTQVRAGAQSFAAETEDIGPSGCQLVAPGALARGAAVSLTFANVKLKGSLNVEGKVAWGSSRPPWRVGVAFVEKSRVSAQVWFDQLVAAYPGLGGYRRVPDRLPVDAMVFLAPPPSFLFDFSAEEVEVLRHVAGGTTIASLRDRLGADWSAMQRALFGLMARGAVTINRSAAVHPSAWKKVMIELEAEFVRELPRAGSLAPILERPVAVRGSATLQQDLDGSLGLDLGFDLGPTVSPPPLPTPLPMKVPTPLPTPLPASHAGPLATEPWAQTPASLTGGATAGTGWRGGGRPRSPQAQESLDLGKTELAAGRSNSAMAHLRRALQLAPGDPEVAAELGRAMTGAPPR